MMTLLFVFLTLILSSALHMALDTSVTMTRSIGFVVVRTVVEWTTVFPCLLIAKAIEKIRDNLRVVACVLVACAATFGLFLGAYSLQVKTWKEEAAKDPVGFCSADWRLSRLQAREAGGNPVSYETVLGCSATVRWDRDQVLVFEGTFGDWTRWSVFEVSPDGDAKKIGQRDIASGN